MRGSSVGSASPSKLREGRQHLSADETTPRCCRRTKPTVGSQHGAHCRNAHGRKDVDTIKPNYSKDRHPESLADMDRFSASSGHHSSSHCRGMRPEEADYSSAQSTAGAKLKDSTKSSFWYLPVSSRQRNLLFVGEM